MIVMLIVSYANINKLIISYDNIMIVMLIMRYIW